MACECIACVHRGRTCEELLEKMGDVRGCELYSGIEEAAQVVLHQLHNHVEMAMAAVVIAIYQYKGASSVVVQTDFCMQCPAA